MNARLPIGQDSLGIVLSELWDQELERNALGAAMLGEPMPPWLKVEHFFPAQHQRIYQTVLDVGGHVAKVYEWLRESAPMTGPIIARSDELAAMCLEWKHARDMGWAFEWEKIRELYNQRRLVEVMRRIEIELRHEQITHKEARKKLAEHFTG